jgi:ubiquitin carboxyl-terminal hydrolase 4/11
VHISTQPLDLTPYCNPAGLAQPGSPRPIYQLTALSRHSGSLSGGHYTAMGKNAVDGCWYHFDDEHASEENPPAGSSTSAYVLFYQLLNTPASSL